MQTKTLKEAQQCAKEVKEEDVSLESQQSAATLSSCDENWPAEWSLDRWPESDIWGPARPILGFEPEFSDSVSYSSTSSSKISQ